MSIAQQSPIPAGWYPDPEGRPEKRWWNGSSWTGSYAPVVAAPVAVAPAIPMTFMLTDPSQLASVPPGPGYSSLLATLSRTPTYAEPITGPTDLAGGAYASAPPPSIHQPTVTPPAPAQTNPAATVVPGLAALPAAASPVPAHPVSTGNPVRAISASASSQVSAPFTPPASWAPPVVPTVPVPASIATQTDVQAPREFSYAPREDYELPREFRVKPKSPYLAPLATEAPPTEAVAPVEPVVAVAAPAEAPRVYGTTNFGTPRLAPIGSAGQAPLVAPFAAPARDEPAVDLSAIASDAVAYQPFGMVPVINRGRVGPPVVVYTASAWVLGLLPVVAGAAAITIAMFLTEFYTRFAQIGLIGVVVLVAFIAAARDRRQLADAGHHDPASPAWILLTPIAYLTVRTIRTVKESRRGFGTLIASIVSTGVLAAAIILLPEWVATLLVTTIG